MLVKPPNFRRLEICLWCGKKDQKIRMEQAGKAWECRKKAECKLRQDEMRKGTLGV